MLRFEWRYHTRQASFLGAAVLFFGVGFALAATGFGPANVDVNSPYSITESLGLASLLSVFVVALFCANAVVRDREHQMEEIVFATSIGKRSFLAGRFAGAFLAAFTAFGAAVPGMLLALAMPWQDAARIGPLRLEPYLWALLVLVLPGMLAAAAALFAVSTLTRSVIASVVGAVFIYVFYFVAASLTNSPLMAGSIPGSASPAWASLLDPFGLAAFFEQTGHWTAVERNARLVAASGHFLLNRLLWIAAAGGLLLVTYRGFSFRVLGRARRRRGAAVLETEALPGARERPEAAGYRPAAALGVAAGRALGVAVRRELRACLRLPFWLLTLLWAGLAASEIVTEVTGGEYGTALYPTTGLIGATLQQPLALVATVVLIWYSAEVMWRERAVGMAEILAATPAPGAVFVVAKWLALTALAAILTVTGLATGAIVQLMMGSLHPQPLLWLQLGWLMLAPLALFATGAVLLQTLSPHKYLGIVLVLALAIVTLQGDSFGLDHPLWRFAALPPLRHSAIKGFGPGLVLFHWLFAWWAGVGGLLLVAASALWRRTAGDRTASLRHELVRGTGAAGRAAALALAVVTLATGGSILYNVNHLNHWESRGARRDWRAGYERKYAPSAGWPQPRVTAITAHFTLEPRQRRYRVAGSYGLHNPGPVAIAEVLVAVPRELRVAALSVAAARLVGHDERFATWRFKFDRPLPPGGRTRLDFDLADDRAGFAGEIENGSMANDGSVLVNQRVLPAIGYREGYELTDPAQRRRAGLPVKAVVEANGEGPAVDGPAEWVALDLTVSTAADQRVVAPGRLVRSWQTAGRRHFHFRSERPVRNVFFVVSGRFARQTAQAGAVRIVVDYHPGHEANVDRILKAAKDALRWCEKSFGPYPGRELRIVELPGDAPFGGFAGPGVIYLNEARSFLIDSRDPTRVDLVTRRVAHEVAHQWWGHQVAATGREGASVVTESLAKYTEAKVLEAASGRAVLRQSLAYELDLYLAGRATAEDEEVPLARTRDEAWLYYRKGSLVMLAIADLVGEEAFDGALRDLVTAEAGAGHQPTVDDLLRRIYAVTPPADQPLVHQWLEEVVLYDLRVESAAARRRADGRFEVTLDVEAAKSRATGRGADTPLPLDEEIEIGLYAHDPDRLHPGRREPPLHLARHRLRSGHNRLTIVVDRRPEVAAVDPYLTRIDRNRLDNLVEVGGSR